MTKNGYIINKGLTDLVTFIIRINGKELPFGFPVNSIVVTKEVNRIPSARLVLADGDPTITDFKISNEPWFIAGNEIEILAGYHSNNERIFKGIIIKHGIKIRKNRSSVLVIDCRDKAFRLTLLKRSRYFTNVSDSDTIKEILASYKMYENASTVNDTAVIHPQIVQYEASDWDFILTRAELNGKVCIADDGKFSVEEPAFTSETQLNLLYGATVMECDAEIDGRNHFAEIITVTWDPAKQKLAEAKAEEIAFQEGGNQTAEEIAELMETEDLTLFHAGNLEQGELQAWSNACKLKHKMAKIRGRVKFEGYAKIKPGDFINLEGIGKRLSGKAFVSGVLQQIVNGVWETDVQFGLAPEWFSQIYNIHTPPASGLLPAVNGLQIGIVTHLEDPEKQGRVKVKLPMVENMADGIWARIAALDAGNNRGAVFMPEVGDEVILGFINSDPRHPVIVGSLFSSSKPAPVEVNKNNHQKGYVSRSGMKFLFDDEKNSVSIETPSGKSIRVSEKDKSIKMKDEYGNEVSLGSGGVTIKSGGNIILKAGGDVSIAGNNINNKASINYKAEGDGGLEVSSSAIAVLKGSLVQIN